MLRPMTLIYAFLFFATASSWGKLPDTAAHPTASCPRQFEPSQMAALTPPAIPNPVPRLDDAYVDFYLDGAVALEAAIADYPYEKAKRLRDWELARGQRDWVQRMHRKRLTPSMELRYAELREIGTSCQIVKLELQLAQNKIVLQQNRLRVAWLQKLREQDPKDMSYLRLLEYQVKILQGELEISLAQLVLEESTLNLEFQRQGHKLDIPGFNSSVYRDAQLDTVALTALVSATQEKIKIYQTGIESFRHMLESMPENNSPAAWMKAQTSRLIRELEGDPKLHNCERGWEQQLLRAAWDYRHALIGYGLTAPEAENARAQLIERLAKLDQWKTFGLWDEEETLFQITDPLLSRLIAL